MDKHQLASYVAVPNDELPVTTTRPRRSSRARALKGFFLAVVTLAVLGSQNLWSLPESAKSSHVPLHAQETLAKCKNLHVLPAPPPDFAARKESDRYAAGTPPYLIKNATIWTGRVNGLEILHGDVLLEKGLVKDIGKISEAELQKYKDLKIYDAHGAWVTPGIFDMHSHLGVYSAPALAGASDGNSLHGPILPWLRSLDGLNTHDDAYKLSISGGVTTAVVLPGSANSIGGQAFAIKLRPTKERTPTSMLLEPPFTINGSAADPSLPPRWRQIKHACGENPSRVYGNTRMDNIWALRSAYEKARQIKVKQDDYCEAALNNQWDGLGEFPDDLQWEVLVDVLRGKVKIHNHCYETVDLNSMILLTQEFKFPIAAFHHAHETYLVTDALKTAYGGAPAAAIFATNARYKRESWRGTEFAPKILHDNGIRVVMKSDHPVLNSRHLIFEAQQAHYYGLPENVALASVTTTPAEVAGYDHRIGYLKKGYDADVVVWDSHPLSLGATPKQVWVDGAAQLESPFTIAKPTSFQKAPKAPNWDKEAAEALKYEGLPPLQPKAHSGVVLFTNISEVFTQDLHEYKVREVFSATAAGPGVVVVKNGKIVCTGTELTCASSFAGEIVTERVDLEGGAISPSLISFGSNLGLVEIAGEASTQDGAGFDPLTSIVPDIAGGAFALNAAVDGLQFGTRDALIAYIRGGISTGITAPTGSRYGGGWLKGLSTAFSLSSEHKLEKGAVLQNAVALHIAIGHTGAPSVSTQIGALRNLFSGHGKGELGAAFEKIRSGALRLVIHVNSADIIASLLRLKEEVERDGDADIKLVLVGAAEAHLIAGEIGKHGVGVVLVPARPYPASWESRRILPGIPLTEKNAFTTLRDANVTVGLGVPETWAARNTRLDVGWAALDGGEDVSKREALALASVNLAKLLGLDASIQRDLVATKGGGLLDQESRVVGMISPIREKVDLF